MSGLEDASQNGSEGDVSEGESEGVATKTENAASEDKNASASDLKNDKFLVEKFLVIGFLLAVPLAVILVAVAPWKTSSSKAGSAGGLGRASEKKVGRFEVKSPELPAIRKTGALEEKLEFVGPDAPVTKIVPFRSIEVPKDADEAMALEKWSSGTVKVTSREWSLNDSAIEEVCFFEQDGNALGCGIYRDGEKLEGIFVRWGTPVGKLSHEATVLREIVSYRDGLKDGIARSYRFDGSPLLETTFDKGQQVHKRVFRQQGNEVMDLGTRRVDGLPESRRSRNTVD